MKKMLLPLLLLLASCSNKVLDEPPLNYSMLPKYLPMDSICTQVQDDTNTVVDSTYKDYDPIFVRAGKYITPKKDTVALPMGALVSDRWMALHPFYKSAWERYRKELLMANKITQSYYDGAKAGEIQYQSEILRLRKLAKRSWLEENAIYLGFAGGIVAALLTEYAVVKVSR